MHYMAPYMQATRMHAQGLITALNSYHATQVTEFFLVSERVYTVHQTSTGFFLYV